MTSVFDIYYSTLISKLLSLNSLKEVSEMEKMLKQMSFELSLAGVNEQGLLKKKYNQCQDQIKDLKAKLTLEEEKYETESTLNETSISKNCDLEQNTFLMLNSGHKLDLITQISNEIEGNGKDIALQLDGNKGKFINAIGKVNGLNSTLDSSGQLLSKMMATNNKGKTIIGAFAIILLAVLLVIFLIKI